MTTPTTPTDVSAQWYVDEVLAQIPRTLTLMDRALSSSTYRRFDRHYAHYRTRDVPNRIMTGRSYT